MIDKKFTDNEHQEIINAYFEYFYSYTNRNWQAMISKFAKDITMYGTGIDEISLSKKGTLNLFSREFEQSPTTVKFEIQELEIFKLSENIAYLMISMDMEFTMPDKLRECSNNRTTAIMTLEEGEWKLTHGHWSQPAEGQELGESVPYKLLKEKNRELEEKVIERTKEIEKQNIELHKLDQAKTNLLSIIAHDLRSPFNAFMGLTEVMLMNFDENIEDPEYFKTRVELINREASYLFNVADNLLNWAWTQTDEIVAKKVDTNLGQVLKSQISILQNLNQGKRVDIKTISKKEISLNTDPEILGIIIRNLVSNSIKFSHKGKSISVDYSIKGGNIIIKISDSGVGMGDDRVKEVLGSNTNKSTLGTENERGIGLGLTICRYLIDKLGGRLYISSKEGEGTDAIISIPKG